MSPTPWHPAPLDPMAKIWKVDARFSSITLRSLIEEHVLLIILKLFPPCSLLLEPVRLIILPKKFEKVI